MLIMKRTLLTIFILVVLLLSFSVLFACNSEHIKEYNGTPLTNIVYKVFCGDFGDYINTLDFENNTITEERTTWLENGEKEWELVSTKSFTEEDEKKMIDRIYTYGLFKIKKRYDPNGAVDDGDDWELNINFEDGSVVQSSGYSERPVEIFKKCSIAIYDQTQCSFLGCMPHEYTQPPKIDVDQTSRPKSGQGGVTTVGVARLYKYKWHTTTVDNGDLYQFASTLRIQNDAFRCTNEGDYNYISLGTINNYNCYSSEYREKFSRCVVKEYDYNAELTNEKVLLDTGWISEKKPKKVDIQQNKIYTIELTFSHDWYSIEVFRT